MRSTKHRSCARIQSIPAEVLWSKRGCPAESLRLLPTQARIETCSISGVEKKRRIFLNIAISSKQAKRLGEY